MTMDVEARPGARTGPRVGFAAAVVGGLALAVVGLAALLDTARVHTHAEFARVGFGLPLDWVVQDQGLDPPLPYSTRLLSPWENPTSVDVVPLAGDVLVVGLVLLGLWWVVRATRRRPRRSRR